MSLVWLELLISEYWNCTIHLLVIIIENISTTKHLFVFKYNPFKQYHSKDGVTYGVSHRQRYSYDLQHITSFELWLAFMTILTHFLLLQLYYKIKSSIKRFSHSYSQVFVNECTLRGQRLNRFSVFLKWDQILVKIDSIFPMQ